MHQLACDLTQVLSDLALQPECVRSCLVVSNSATLWTVARQVPLFMGFPRQEYWSGLPFPPPGDLPDPGMEPMSPASTALAGRFLTTVPPVKPLLSLPNENSH